MSPFGMTDTHTGCAIVTGSFGPAVISGNFHTDNSAGPLRTSPLNTNNHGEPGANASWSGRHSGAGRPRYTSLKPGTAYTTTSAGSSVAGGLAPCNPTTRCRPSAA